MSKTIGRLKPTLPIHCKVDEGADGDAGGAFGHVGLGFVVPGGAGDIEVHPGGSACEFLDEISGGDRGTGAVLERSRSLD